MTDAPALLLRDARFPGSDERHDVLLVDGVIAAIEPVGTLAAERVEGAGAAEELHLDGRYVNPGLWDAHVHFTQWVVQQQRFDLSSATSAAEAVALVREVVTAASSTAGASASSPTTTLTGYGFRDGLWPDAPTLAALDGAASDVPVVLISGDLHCGWVNSRAAARYGLTPDASGMLREVEWIAALRVMDEQTTIPDAAYARAAEAAARRGIVGIVDFENSALEREWPARVAAGVTSLRVEASVWPDRLEAAIAAGRRTGDALESSGLARMGCLKVVVDGSLNTRTAFCWDPYPGLDPHAEHACGAASVPIDELRALLVRARDNGIAAAVHAIGDRANSEVLDTFAELGMPGVIEHAQLVREDDFARFPQLGLVASVQPEHAMDDRDVADRYWAGRTARAFAFGSLHAAGAELHLGSDAPVAPLDPWHAIASATARSRGSREPWHPEQALPLDIALVASSRGRAGIATGEPADLVILDSDPLASSRDQLREMPVAATLLAGRFTWRGI